MYLLKENNLYHKQEHPAHCFTAGIEWVLERNTSSKSEFSTWRKAHFVPNKPTQQS
jgi:hypothetical protein